MEKPKSWVALLVIMLGFFVSPHTRAETARQTGPELPEYGVERDLIPPLIHEGHVQSLFGKSLDSTDRLLPDVAQQSAWGDHLFGSGESEFCVVSKKEIKPKRLLDPRKPYYRPLYDRVPLFDEAAVMRLERKVYILARKISSRELKVFEFKIRSAVPLSEPTPSAGDYHMLQMFNDQRYTDFNKALEQTPRCEY